jgi:hypothetical protein
MVMMAGAIRVRLPFALAWPKLLGDFDLRARCLFRSAMVRYFPISLVSVSWPVLLARDGGENRAAGAGVGDLAGPYGLPGAASLPCGDRCEGGVAGDAAGHLEAVAHLAGGTAPTI